MILFVPVERIKMKEPEGIVEATQAVIEFIHSDKSLTSNEWTVIEYLFYFEIKKASSNEIVSAIALIDYDLLIPFHIKCDLHQKLIYLDDNSNNLSKFAVFLRFYGNSWEYLADYFEKIVATRAQIQVNVKS
jgi:hypothetical protein